MLSALLNKTFPSFLIVDVRQVGEELCVCVGGGGGEGTCVFILCVNFLLNSPLSPLTSWINKIKG